MSVNRALILGRVGKDPELNQTKNGTMVCKFSIATANKWTAQDGTKQESTTWHNIVAWGKQATAIGEFVVKGQELFVEGRIENRSYDDKDGNKRYISEIVLTSFSFVGSKADNAKSNKTEQPIKRDSSMGGSFDPDNTNGFDDSQLPF